MHDVYWGDRLTPKLTMSALLEAFHHIPLTTACLHECLKAIPEWRVFVKSLTFSPIKGVYFPNSKPEECGSWNALIIEEVHHCSHHNILRMITCDSQREVPPAICNAGTREDWWMLTGLASREFQKSSMKPNRCTSTEVCKMALDQNPTL